MATATIHNLDDSHKLTYTSYITITDRNHKKGPLPIPQYNRRTGGTRNITVEEIGPIGEAK